MAKRDLSIWFFIGVSLLGDGLLILGEGIKEWLIPPAAAPVVLYHLHAAVWWGAVLTAVGGFYVARHRPGRAAKAKGADAGGHAA